VRYGLLLVSLLIGACGEDSPIDRDAGRDAAVATDAAPDAEAPCQPQDLTPRDPEVFEAVLDHLVAEETQLEGDWDGDFGDATAWAPPVLTLASTARCDPALGELARLTLQREATLVREFTASFSGEALVGGFGLVETFAISGDPEVGQSATAIVEYAGSLLDLVGYLSRDAVEGSGLPYGQTATTALLVALELRYVERVDPADDGRLAAALGHIQAVEEAAWSAELGYYRFNEDDDELHVYPNAAMMAVHALAGRLSGDAWHLDRAESLFDAVQPLWRPEAGGYHDSYQGTGDDYISLSTESYFILALQLLARERPDPRYLDAIDTLFSFIESRLYDPTTAIAYHHWEYAERADWYCTGCNFQLLYMLLLVSGSL
jgi:hypothetical protein